MRSALALARHVLGYRVSPAADSAHDRFRGCLLGLAIGDAVGTTLEFMRPGTFEPITDMNGGGPFGLPAGAWTDDTSMALCLAESLVDRGGFDARDQMDRYVRWYRQGYLSSTGTCFDIGNTTRAALERFERTREPFAGDSDPSTAGNGSIMRLAPVAMYYARTPFEAIARCAESSRTTHGAVAAVDGCRLLGAIIVHLLNGAEKSEVLSDQHAPPAEPWAARALCPKVADIASGSFKRKAPPEIRGTGYVIQSLEAALWAFHRSESFRDGCLIAANLGEDADTTAAVYGQIAGAWYGGSAIPEAWLARLSKRGTIERLADGLSQKAEP